MENASQALLIAGAVIMGMLIITVAMLLYVNLVGMIDSGGGSLDSMEVNLHNAKFDVYRDYVMGSDVKACISEFLLYNNNSTQDFFRVSLIVNDETTSPTTITYVNRNLVGSGRTAYVDNSSNTIQSYYQYTSRFTYADTGAITEIYFTRVIN